jgi:hypothetical protein
MECEATLAELENAEAAPATSRVSEATEAAWEDPLPDSVLAEIRGGVGALRKELAPV